VPWLPEAVDSLWTGASLRVGTRPQPDHNLLGQPLRCAPGLPTATWITPPLRSRVTHTAHSPYDGWS